MGIPTPGSADGEGALVEELMSLSDGHILSTPEGTVDVKRSIARVGAGRCNEASSMSKGIDKCGGRGVRVSILQRMDGIKGITKERESDPRELLGERMVSGGEICFRLLWWRAGGVELEEAEEAAKMLFPDFFEQGDNGNIEDELVESVRSWASDVISKMMEKEKEEK